MDDLNVDTVQGFSMFSLRPYWFRDFDFSILEESVRSFNDDILISGLLEYLQIDRIQIGPYQLPQVLHQAEINPIHGDGRLVVGSMKALEYLQARLPIWEDVRVEYPEKSGLLRRVMRKIKSYG